MSIYSFSSTHFISSSTSTSTTTGKSKLIGYSHIIQNRLRVRFKEACYQKCACRINDEKPCSINNRCINFLSNIECSPEFCPAKKKCHNQNFRLGSHFAFQVRKTEAKGWGLFAMEEIPAEHFIIEYMGEVIDNMEFEYRFKATKDENFYFFALNQNMYIDSKIYGNQSRFINHSCDPNAVPNKWIVYSNGQEHTRIGLFALRKILPVGYIELTKLFSKINVFELYRMKK